MLKDGKLLGRHVVYREEIYVVESVDFNGNRLELTNLKTGKRIKTPAGSGWVTVIDEVRDVKLKDYRELM